MVVNWDFWNLAMKALLWEDQGIQWENALAVESTGVKKKKKKLQQLNIRSRNVKCDLSIDLPSYQTTYLSIYQSINHLSTYLLYLPTYCLICREMPIYRWVDTGETDWPVKEMSSSVRWLWICNGIWRIRGTTFWLKKSFKPPISKALRIEEAENVFWTLRSLMLLFKCFNTSDPSIRILLLCFPWVFLHFSGLLLVYIDMERFIPSYYWSTNVTF